jgi:hypothetical protein
MESQTRKKSTIAKEGIIMILQYTEREMWEMRKYTIKGKETPGPPSMVPK